MNRAGKLQNISTYTAIRWRQAAGAKALIERQALSLLGYQERQTFLAGNYSQTAVVLFLAGAGSRWGDPTRPRALAPVEDVTVPGEKIPVGLYNLRASAGLGRLYVIYRTHLDEIKALVERAGISEAVFFEQKIPLGHGDALRQLYPFLSPTTKFVLTLFGGDVTSRETLFLSLVTLAALQQRREEERPWGILPTTYINNPTYAVELDRDGLPIGFRHTKLTGERASAGGGVVRYAQSNVGVRAYLKDGLPSALSHLGGFFVPEKGYQIPGNATSEFALDNLDRLLAYQRRLRCLCVARPEEIVPLKQRSDLDRFIAAQRVVLGLGQAPD